MYRFLIVIITLFINGIAWGQLSTNSPYSSRGIGDVGFYGDAYTGGFGGITTVLTDSSQANIYNPSTYSLVAKQLPLFAFGMNHYQKFFTSPGQMKSNGNFTGISHMALVVPFGNRFGMAGGLKPFSRAGYEINDGTKVQGDSIFYTYKGKGEIYEAFLGFSANVVDARQHTLSLGVNGKLYFGRIENERRAFTRKNTTESGGMDVKSIRARGFGLDVALNYEYRPSPSHSIRVAGIYRPGLGTKFEKSLERIYFSNYHSQQTYDTILKATPTGGSVYLPSKTSVGIGYTFRPEADQTSARRLSPAVSVMLEYTLEEWGRYEEFFMTGHSKDEYVNADVFRLGIQYIPHRVATDRGAFTNYFHKINYRIGGYWSNSAYEINGEQLTDKGISVGFGFPFVMSRAVSTVNFSVNYGSLSAPKSSVGVRENYLGFNLGINIAPGYDRWFRKYKLD